VAAGLTERIQTAGMLVNGPETALLDNFKLTVQPATDDALDMQASVLPPEDAPTQANKPDAPDESATLPPGAVTVTIGPEQRQTFKGFGANIMGGPDFYKLSEEDHAQLAEALYGDDMRFNSMRLWFYTYHFREDRDQGLKDFQERYVNNGILRHARNAGMTKLLMCGDMYPPQWTTKDEKGREIIKPETYPLYAQRLAETVAGTRDEDGVTIDYVALQNEPGAHDPFRPQDFPGLIKALRTALDERGLEDVQIVAPSTADVGTSFFKMVELTRADPEAWAALDVLAGHSYAAASNPRAAKIVEETGKPLWMTEASNAPPNDSRAATNNTGLAMNDLNHMASVWMWFIGYATPAPDEIRGGGNGPRLMMFETEPFRIIRPLKFYYFQSLSHTFDVGAVFRQPMSQTEGTMQWPGKTAPPPRITVTAAKNPDGSFGVAALNYTVGPDTPPATSDLWPWPRRPGHTQQSFDVTIVIDELADAGSVPMTVHRCGEGLERVQEDDVMLTDGKVTITVNPMQLVTLRSQN